MTVADDAPETSVDARCDDDKREAEAESDGTRAWAVRSGVAAGVRLSSSVAPAGARRSRGTTVLTRDDELAGSSEAEGARLADDARDVLLLLRGICDVASESSLRLVDDAVAPPACDDATMPNSPRSFSLCCCRLDEADDESCPSS